MKINFGKYKGHSIEDISYDDPGYLVWLLEQDWINEYNNSYELRFHCTLWIVFRYLKRLDYFMSEEELEDTLVENGFIKKQTQVKQPRGVKLVSKKIMEALKHRGFTEAEAEQMINKLIAYKDNAHE